MLRLLVQAVNRYDAVNFGTSFRMREYCASLLKVCVMLDLILWRIVLQGCFCIHLKLNTFKFDIED